jgi:EpsI family protein
MMRSNRLAFVIAALMCGASIAAVATRPGTKAADLGPAISLEAMVPKHFGDWREEPQRIVQVVNPQQRATLDKLYSQILERSYVNADGYRIMLSLAYASDQRGYLRAHYPEACYSAAGFTLHRREESRLATLFGEIPVRRLFTSKGPREEPLTYWLKVGDKTVQGWQSRLVELTYTFTGRIPDGLLFRVSSIDPDQARANQMQDQFINQLLQAVSPTERKRLSGLGDS